MVAADDIDVGRQQDVLPDPNVSGRADLAVETEVGLLLQPDIAILAGENGVATHEDTVFEIDPAVVDTLRIQQAVVVDDDVRADAYLAWMAKDHVLTERDISAARPKEQRVELAPQEEPQRAGYPRRRQQHQLVAQQREEAAPTDDQLGILLCLALPFIEKLLLGDIDARIVGALGGVQCHSTHSNPVPKLWITQRTPTAYFGTGLADLGARVAARLQQALLAVVGERLTNPLF